MSTGLILFIIACVVFGILWKNGQLVRLRVYIEETKEELKKCTWPSRDELKGSTLVVIISVASLTAFTFVSDIIVHFVVKLING